MAKRLFNAYSNLVKKRPLLTQIGTSGIITTTGDILAQSLEDSSKSYDRKRTLIMSSFGFCYFGPLVTIWLRILKQLNMGITYTVICDQFLFAPNVTAGFIFLHPLLSGKSFKEAKNIFRSSYIDVVSRGWLLWCPAQIINFAFVPFEFRVLYIQCVALLWNAFLSYRSNCSLRS